MSDDFDPTKVKVETLRVDSIDAIPQYFDFSEGYGKGWDYYPTVVCGDCSRVVIHEEDHADECDCAWGDARDLGAEGPVMNYLYPLRVSKLDPCEVARKLAHTVMCLVWVRDGDEYSLGLCGGGMDFSWEICEAYIRLGYLPPTHFCRLPRMADKYDTPLNRLIVAACRRSVEVQKGWRERDLADLEVTFLSLKEREGVA